MPFLLQNKPFYINFLAALLLGCIAGLVNLLPVFFLDSSEFLLGQFFVILSLLLLGWRYAIITFIISTGFIFYRWGHAWVIHCFCLRAYIFTIILPV
ncbi:hypothetical protein [Pseudoalteromonas sp. GB43]